MGSPWMSPTYFFIDNEVVDGELPFWRVHVNARFSYFSKLGMTSEFRGNRMFSANSKIHNLCHNTLDDSSNLACIEGSFL
jgi:hypothetical protein